MLRYLFIISLLSSLKIMATTFVPLTIKQQVKVSQAIVQGEVLFQEAVELDGEIFTRVDLNLERWMGVKVLDNQMSVYFPGGELGGRRQLVYGAPKLNLGEKVVLMLSLNRDKMWINNLGLGKFSIKRIGEQNVIVNQIFPAHPDVGQMNLDKFIVLAEWVKKQEFKKRFKDKYEINHEKTVKNHRNVNKRSVASIGAEERREGLGIPLYWLVILLGAMGVMFKLVRNRSTR